MARASSETNSDGRIERVNRDRERITALVDEDHATAVATIDRDAPRDEIREDLKEIAIELLRIVIADRKRRSRADGGPQARCSTCDAPITAISSSGPATHRLSPCGHAAGRDHLARLVDDPELWISGRIS